MSENDNGVPMALAVSKLTDLFQATPTRIFTSLDTANDLGRAMTMVYMQSGTALPLQDHIDKAIPVQHFIVHTIQFADDDGVEITTDRIVLISPDGTAYAAVSNGVRRSLQMLMVMFGVPPYDPPKMIKAVGVKTRRGFRALTLVPVIDVLRAQVVSNGAEVKQTPKAAEVPKPSEPTQPPATEVPPPNAGTPPKPAEPAKGKR